MKPDTSWLVDTGDNSREERIAHVQARPPGKRGWYDAYSKRVGSGDDDAPRMVYSYGYTGTTPPPAPRKLPISRRRVPTPEPPAQKRWRNKSAVTWTDELDERALIGPVVDLADALSCGRNVVQNRRGKLKRRKYQGLTLTRLPLPLSGAPRALLALAREYATAHGVLSAEVLQGGERSRTAAAQVVALELGWRGWKIWGLWAWAPSLRQAYAFSKAQGWKGERNDSSEGSEGDCT